MPPHLDRSVPSAGIGYGGLVELIVNAMEDVKPGFIDWEWH